MRSSVDWNEISLIQGVHNIPSRSNTDSKFYLECFCIKHMMCALCRSADIQDCEWVIRLDSGYWIWHQEIALVNTQSCYRRDKPGFFAAIKRLGSDSESLIRIESQLPMWEETCVPTGITTFGECKQTHCKQSCHCVK